MIALIPGNMRLSFDTISGNKILLLFVFLIIILVYEHSFLLFPNIESLRKVRTDTKLL